jgi:hypothetical protein
MKSSIVILLWFSSLLCTDRDTVRFFKPIFKFSDISPSIQSSGYLDVFAVVPKIIFFCVSLKIDRRFNAAPNFKFFIRNHYINNLITNSSNLFFNYSIIYLTKELIGLEIFLCKLII